MLPEQSGRFHPSSDQSGGPAEGAGALQFSLPAVVPEQRRWVSNHRLEQAAIFIRDRQNIIETVAELCLPDLDDGENRFFEAEMTKVKDRYEDLRDSLRGITSELDALDAELTNKLSPEFGGFAPNPNRDAVLDILSSRLSPALNRLLTMAREGAAFNEEVCEKARAAATEAGAHDSDDDDAPSPGPNAVVIGGGYQWFDAFIISQRDFLRQAEIRIESITCPSSIFPDLPRKAEVGAWITDACRFDDPPAALADERWNIRIHDQQGAISAMQNARHLMLRVAMQALDGEMLRLYFDERRQLPPSEQFVGSKAFRTLTAAADFPETPELEWEREPKIDGKPRVGILSYTYTLPASFGEAVKSAYRSEESAIEAVMLHAESAGMQLRFEISSEPSGHVALKAKFRFVEEPNGKGLPEIHPETARSAQAIQLGDPEPTPDYPKEVSFHCIGAFAPVYVTVPQEALFTPEGRKFLRDSVGFAQTLFGGDPAYQALVIKPMSDANSAVCEKSFKTRNGALSLLANVYLIPGMRPNEEHPLNVVFPWESDEGLERHDFKIRLEKYVLGTRQLIVEPPLLDDPAFCAKLLELNRKVRFLKAHLPCEPDQDGDTRDGIQDTTALLEGLLGAAQTLMDSGAKKLYVAELESTTQRSSLSNLRQAFNFYDSKGALLARGWFYTEQGIPPQFQLQPIRAAEILNARRKMATAMSRCERSEFESYAAVRSRLEMNGIVPCETLVRTLLISDSTVLLEGERPYPQMVEGVAEFFNSPFVWVEERDGKLHVRHLGDRPE